MKIGVIGAGCVGTVIATRLFDYAQADVFFIADEKRRNALSRDGISVNNRHYDIPIAEIGKDIFDLVFICVKNYQLKEACTLLNAYVSPNTRILPLLNGISPVPEIKHFFPNNDVLYGYITKIDSCRKEGAFSYNIAGEIHFGYSRNEEENAICNTILHILTSAGFEAKIDKDMVRGIWKKWMLNIGANQVSALTEADYLEFGRIMEVGHILRMAMNELLKLAEKEKVDLNQEDVDDLIIYLTTYPYPKKTSMLQDVLAKRKTEIESISGDILKLSKKWNISCPVNETMFYLIRVKEQVYLR